MMWNDCPTKVLALALFCLFTKGTADAKALNLLGLLPMTGKGWPGGGACLPSIHMAIEDINAREDILNGFNLTYENIDSECDPDKSLFKMFKALYGRKKYTMLLGPLCSTAAQATAQVSHLWNLTQVSAGTSSTVLSDRNRFPTFYRLGSPESKHIPARIDLMKTFNWNKIAIIYQAVEFFSVVVDDFLKEIQNNNISIVSQEIFLQDPAPRVQNLKAKDARIIYTAMYEDKARLLLCEAYKKRLYGPKIVWLFSGWFAESFWKLNLEHVGCTEEEMNAAIEGAFLFVSIYRNPVEERGVANLTVSEFDERFYGHHLYDHTNKQFDFCAPRCYDQMWLVALTLNCTQQRMRELGINKTLDMFDYDGDINKIIFECMGNASFIGLSGHISFENGDPDRIVKLERVQEGKRVLVAYYRQDKRPHYYEWFDGALKWKDGNIPRGSTYTIDKETVTPKMLHVTMCILAGLGILLACCFLFFNIYHRNNKIVRMSSPTINNLLLMGCIVCYTPVFIKTTETANAGVCKIRVFLLCIGFTVTLGSLFSKTWCVYRIFTNKKMQRRTIKDVQLLGLVAVLVSIVLTVLVAWELVEPHQMVVEYLEKDVVHFGNDKMVRPFVRVCRSGMSVYFAWAIYIMEGVLLAFGAFLAWATRKVKIAALNDSQQIGICLYNVIILSAIGLTVSLLLKQEVTIYGVTSGCLIIGTTVTQCIVFVPKVRIVWANTVDIQKEGNTSIPLNDLQEQAFGNTSGNKDDRDLSQKSATTEKKLLQP